MRRMRLPSAGRHRQLPSLTLAHIDCDAFYATVEKRDNPELADKPVIIGGGKRGVVSAACYISRTFGVEVPRATNCGASCTGLNT